MGPAEDPADRREPEGEEAAHADPPVAGDRGVDADRDPEAAKRGSLLPFGGHKGFALAPAMQALGVLAGSSLNANKDYGYLFIAVRPDLLVPLDEFKRELTQTLERVKSTPRQPGVAEIRLPSERAFRERERALRHGIVIDRRIHQALRYLATQADLGDEPAG